MGPAVVISERWYYNVSNVLTVLPEIGLVVIGVSILMIAGEFDLSVGSVFALTPMVAFTLAESVLPTGLTLCIAMACALLVGLINGTITQVYHLSSFITTLGMPFVVRSLTISVSGGFPPPFAADAPTYLFSDFVGPVRISMIWFFVLFAIAAFGLRNTNYGVWTYATGGQKEVTKSVGINTFRVKMTAFMMCSALAGFAGLLQVFRLRSPLPSLGEGLKLQVITAAVIGCVALTGGFGTVLGAVLGLLLLKVIENGLILVGIEVNWFKFATGAIMILAVILNANIAKFARNSASGDGR